MTTAFVLSGGGSLGAVQVGMLQALAKRGFEPDLLVGASAGALNAAFVAGRGFSPATLEELADVWRRLRRQDVFPLTPHRHLLALAGARSALCAPDRLRQLIAAHLTYRRLEDAAVPVHVVATDVLSDREVLLSAGDPVPAVLASASIPAVLPPVEFEGRILFDGGVANNTPISHAVGLGADRVVVLPTGFACALPRPPRSALATAVHAISLLIAQRLVVDVAAYREQVELIVLPPLCPLSVSSADFRHAGILIDRARNASGQWLDAGHHRLPRPERFLSLHHHTALAPAADHETRVDAPGGGIRVSRASGTRDFRPYLPRPRPLYLQLRDKYRAVTARSTRTIMTKTHQPTLGELVTRNPAAADVLERFGLDYCCHGDRTLDEACSSGELDIDDLAAELGALDVPPQAAADWTVLEPPALARDIVSTHHRYLHEELPIVDTLAERVLTVHEDRHQELAEVRRLVAALRADLEPHMAKEERVLFPAIDAVARGQRDFPFGTIANPIRMMCIEHDRAGELLAQLHDVSDGYRVPADACASYRSLYERLAALEADTHLHIHKENNVLFPAVLRLVQAFAGAGDQAG